MGDSEDRDALLAASTKVASSDWRDEEDEEKHITAHLYKAVDGRHFRFIESSGMNTGYSGATGIVEWLEQGDIATWNQW